MTRVHALLWIAVVLFAAAHLLASPADLAALWRADPDTAATLLGELRLPRTLLALGYGAVLGLCGAALQAIFANPLASPDITGSSSGAALGTVAAAYWLDFASPLGMAVSGTLGALAALGALVLLAGRRAEPATLLLAGLAIALLAGAGTSLLLALAPSPFAFYDSFDWLMGSFVDRSLEQALALVPAGLACLVLARRSDALDLIALGEDVAASLGYQPRRIGIEVVALSAIAVGSLVSVCGAVGFVGLIAPFIARRLSRGHPGKALVPAAAIGALLMLAADLALRLAPAGRSLPVGVVTTMVGTPLFLWILFSMRRRLAS